jgi:hypothetical protein
MIATTGAERNARQQSAKGKRCGAGTLTGDLPAAVRTIAGEGTGSTCSARFQQIFAAQQEPKDRKTKGKFSLSCSFVLWCSSC